MAKAAGSTGYHIITGGAGFIGSVTAGELNQLGEDRIIISDHLGESAKWRNLRGLRFQDYLEKDLFRRMIADGDFDNTPVKSVVHFGACSSTTEKDCSYLADNNFQFSKELAEFALRRGIRFVYASSAATYGDGSLGWKDDEAGIASLRPLNMYGYSKQLFDMWAWRNGLFRRITGLKFTNVFGPNEWHKGEMRSVVCKAFDQIRETGRLRLFKSHRKEFVDGGQKRDFLYVRDAAAMAIFLLERRICGLFNIGSGRAETWNRLAECVFKAMGRKPSIEYIDMPESIRAGYQYYTKADISKIRKAGYDRPITPLGDAVREYVVKHLETGRHYADCSLS